MSNTDATRARQGDAIDDVLIQIADWHHDHLSEYAEECEMDEYGGMYWVIERDVSDGLDNLIIEAQNLAATLGAGTCHYIPDDTGFTWWDENDVEHCEEYSASDECCSASCDKCGHAMMVGDEGWFDGWDEITEWWEEDGSYHRGYVLTPRFKFCPNCGAKVVDE